MYQIPPPQEAHYVGYVRTHRRKIAETGVLCFLILVTIGLGTTTLDSFEFFRSVRLLALSISIGCALLLVFLDGVDSSQTFALLFFLGAAMWGLGLSIASGAVDIGYQNTLVDTGVVLLGIVLLIRRDGIFINTNVVIRYVAYAFLMVAATTFFGGLSFDFPPQFSFEYGSDQMSSRVAYGQSVSFFYGLASLAAANLWVSAKSATYRAAWFSLSILLSSLCLLGGGRGEATFSVLLLAVIYLSHATRATLAVAIAVLFLGAYFVEDWSLLEEFAFVTRMFDLQGGDYGMRDELFYEAVVLLRENLGCLLIGCGPGFFQKFYGYEFGLYPHNILLESVITFGLFVTLAALIALVRGAYLHWRTGRNFDVFLLFFVYHFLISMKSGYLFGSWFVIIGGLYFISLALIELPARLRLSQFRASSSIR